MKATTSLGPDWVLDAQWLLRSANFRSGSFARGLGAWTEAAGGGMV
jgi:hypothetical protein